ncbi:Guanine nucleotide-binding proteinalpha-17 subunit [Aphelenchoides fujianensis]|nr:Guanine nucleotide-binding proteinalpha-17 subunit [Aphelenchoides fujianensis]
MGASNSCQNELVRQKRRSRAIDRELHANSHKFTQKLLLLGPGESGKSTLIKQMQILHAEGFTDQELEERRSLVYSNTVRALAEICEAMPRLSIRFADPENQDNARRLKKYVQGGCEFEPFSPEVFLMLKQLWADQGVREAFSRRSLFQCNDSALHFLNDLDRISAPNYLPSNEDIVHTRVPTTGIIKFDFAFNGIHFVIVDVGGQRSERRKWLHCFDDVNALIYVAAISEFDQRLREDDKTNRLTEALELFESVVNTPFFERSSVILFLNKKDLFEEKIRRVSLSVTFKNYKGGSFHRSTRSLVRSGGLNYNDGISFIRRQFMKLYANESKLYVHETCATNTDQVQNVFDSVLDVIVQENLRDTGMM